MTPTTYIWLIVLCVAAFTAGIAGIIYTIAKDMKDQSDE